MKVITINLPNQYIECLDDLGDLGFFPSRSETVRQALKRFLDKEENFVKEIESSVFLKLKRNQMNCLIGE